MNNWGINDITIKLPQGGSSTSILGENNTFTGENTFNNPVTVGAPTAENHAATKQYVDTTIAGITTGLSLPATTANTEYQVPGYTFNGKQVYYKRISQRTRISTTAVNLASNVNVLISQCLSFQAYSGSTPSGEINYFPYIHTDQSVVTLSSISNNLQVQVKSGSFAGTYLVAGWIFYTKNS